MVLASLHCCDSDLATRPPSSSRIKIYIGTLAVNCIGSSKGVTTQKMIHSNSQVYPLGLEPRTNALLPHHPMKYSTPLAKVVY
ncbi:hypothetical protein Pcinc_031440 [Petrolisthes cinctipes]|uniref:Uncharacterized protein n=1 Tax=Petrolisthes cinctipes TaxID=88211 RepID=A0AAE1EW27_PETCI|nr:hypothetical protein Pcinc_031440 [Petrolisthes cinctipes]